MRSGQGIYDTNEVAALAMVPAEGYVSLGPRSHVFSKDIEARSKGHFDRCAETQVHS